jgi:DNA-binding CsgD family transcriptional regulator/PAS domain-containing protein
MDFSAQDVEEFSDLVGLIYETVIDDTAWLRVLERVCGFVSGAASRIYWRDATNSNAETVYSWGFEPRFLDIYRERYVALNPLFPASIFIEPGEVFSSRDLVPADEFQSSRFFREWVSPQGFFDAAIFNIQRYQASAAAFTVITGKDYGAVDDRLRFRLKLLAPHLQRAAMIGREIGRRRQVAQSLEAALDRVEAGVFILDKGGRTVWANRSAGGMLHTGELVLEDEPRLRLASPEANKRLREGLVAAERAASELPDQQSAFIRMTDRAGTEWTGCLMYLPPQTPTRNAFQQIGPAATAALFIRPAELVPATGIEVSAKLHGLTPAEVRVLHAALETDTVAGMADRLGVSVNTVKKHLSSIFAKTGVSRRTALVKMVMAAQT